MASEASLKHTLRMLTQRAADSLRYRAGVVAAAILPEFVLTTIMSVRGYRARFGVFPNILGPRTYNEKILHRILFDRRPILQTLQDKYAVRRYISERGLSDILPRLHWVTQTPSDIPFDDLPRRFVVKPTHGSGWYALIYDQTAMDRARLIAECDAWLRQNYYDSYREWAYKHIEPRILVEEYIDDGTGPYPLRYRLGVFGGRVGIVEVNVGKQGENASFYTPSPWTRLAARFADYETLDRPIPAPWHLAEMIRHAEILAADLDFVRVDMFDTPEKPYFGEMTITPGAGRLPFVPREFDLYLGSLWQTQPHPFPSLSKLRR